MFSPQLLRHHLETGFRAQTGGDLESAAAAYQQALALSPDHPEALNLMGTVLLGLGYPREAADHLRRAAQKAKHQPGVHGNLAQACVAIGNYAEAREAFRKASRLDPDNPYYPIGAATAFALDGKLPEAEKLLRKQAQRFPNEPLVWFNLGNVLRDSGRAAEAVDCFSRALHLDPAHGDARNNLAGALHSLQRFDEAEREYRACIAAVPGHVLARCNLASLLTDVGRFGEAESTLRDVVRLAPHFAEAQKWLGAALTHQGRLAEALACFREAAAAMPDDRGAQAAYAAALVECGRVSEGWRRFTRAPAGGLRYDDAGSALCAALLCEGRIQEGWREYGGRAASIRIREQAPDLPLTGALPERLAGATVCVIREQGLGDELFLLRYVPLLRARGARISYRTSSKLRSMLTRLDGIDEVIEESAPLAAGDAAILLGDLPGALNPLAAAPVSAAAAAFAAPAPVADFDYRISIFWPPLPASIRLPPLTAKLDELRRRLADAGPPPYLGVTWRAGTPPRAQKGADWVLHKAIAPEQLGGALRDHRGTLLALQRRPHPAELDALSAAVSHPVHDFTGLNEDLEAMLALLALIDDYVGVSNTNMHLRAAVGRTARVLVPRPAEWRWLRIGRESPWFPGFAVYRQGLDGSWDRALSALGRDLS